MLDSAADQYAMKTLRAGRENEPRDATILLLALSLAMTLLGWWRSLVP